MATCQINGPWRRNCRVFKSGPPRAESASENKGKNVDRMVRIAISVKALKAIARTLPLGSVGYESKVNEGGERLVWLEPSVVDRLRAMRGPGESYSDVISEGG